MSWKLGMTRIWLCVFLSNTCISAYVSGPGHILLCFCSCITSFKLSLFVYFHLSPLFLPLFPTIFFFPIHLFKVTLNGNHCILFLRIIKFLFPPTLNQVAFSCSYFSWSLKVQCPWEKKCSWLFPWPGMEFSRNVHHVNPLLIYTECWCLSRLVRNKSVKGEPGLSGAERNETM